MSKKKKEAIQLDKYTFLKEMDVLRVKKLTETATIPTRGSACAAGYDLYADVPEGEVIAINPGEVRKIHTNIAVNLPPLSFGGIYARSGLALKEGLRPVNCVGVIDEDYTGEIIVALRNDSNEVRYVEHKQRVAQLVITPYIAAQIREVDELVPTIRGNGGFSSTGR